jgi:hypothetical protein
MSRLQSPNSPFPLSAWLHPHPTKKLSGKAELSAYRINGRDRDRTDDLYRVNFAGVIYPIDSSLFFLHGRAPFSLVFGG